MTLVPIVTIYADLDGDGFVAESQDPELSTRGNTAGIALLKLMLVLQEIRSRENPKSNVVPFRGRRA